MSANNPQSTASANNPQSTASANNPQSTASNIASTLVEATAQTTNPGPTTSTSSNNNAASLRITSTTDVSVNDSMENIPEDLAPIYIIAVVGVGAAVLLLLILVAVLISIWRSRRRRRIEKKASVMVNPLDGAFTIPFSQLQVMDG